MASREAEIRNAIGLMRAEDARNNYGNYKVAIEVLEEFLKGKLNLAQKPVCWEYRHLGSHPQAADYGKWSEWQKVEPRNVYTSTVEDRVAEIQAYIAQGQKYELRALYVEASAQSPRDPVCPRCDGTGDVHSPTGEWRGKCDCSPPPEPPKKDPPYVRKNFNDWRNP